MILATLFTAHQVFRPVLVMNPDPKGYYQSLEIAPSASQTEVKSAYYHLAKLFHPDQNPLFGARRKILEINEAWRILGKAERRLDYDSVASLAIPFALVDPDDAAPKPLGCSLCGHIMAQPRFIVFRQVEGQFFKTDHRLVKGVYCRDCAEKIKQKVNRINKRRGWRSPSGLVAAPFALLSNELGGMKPSPENFWLLHHQARAFLAMGKLDFCAALGIQARSFAQNAYQRKKADSLIKLSSPLRRRLKNRWRLSTAQRWTRGLAAASFLLTTTMAGFIGGFYTEKSGAPAIAAAPSDMRYAAIDRLKVREGPSATDNVSSMLERFTTVAVISHTEDRLWAKIVTPKGIAGYVETKYLFAGDGATSRIRWCADHIAPPPANGAVLQQLAKGDNQIHIVNVVGSDAIVKIKNDLGHAVATVFIAANNSARIDSLPDGPLQIYYAIGQDYSDVCRLYMERMEVYRMRDLSFSDMNEQPKNAEIALSFTDPKNPAMQALNDRFFDYQN